jgi:hypothetical protein
VTTRGSTVLGLVGIEIVEHGEAHGVLGDGPVLDHPASVSYGIGGLPLAQRLADLLRADTPTSHLALAVQAEPHSPFQALRV